MRTPDMVHFRPMKEMCGAVIPKHHPVDKRLRVTQGTSKYMFACVHACILGSILNVILIPQPLVCPGTLFSWSLTF